MESYEEWVKKRNRYIIFSAAFPPVLMFVFFVLWHILAPGLPRIFEFNGGALVLIVGWAVLGPKAARMISLSEDDLLTAYSSIVMLCLLFFFGFNMFYFVDSGIVATTDIAFFIRYSFTLTLPVSLSGMLLAYEILDGRRNRSTIVFHIKRFAERLFCVYIFFVIWLLMTLALSFFYSLFFSFMVSGLFSSIILFVAALQFREFFEKLWNAEL